jgi:hypothetical protein
MTKQEKINRHIYTDMLNGGGILYNVIAFDHECYIEFYKWLLKKETKKGII